ncbi:MAG: trimeric autotransporter adhesin [Blastocatellia bacterium]|jgi:CSLREA domain-containing protein|nr:trimeric autotransporter adhesin [Blastocatellia bacterium]
MSVFRQLSTSIPRALRDLPAFGSSRPGAARRSVAKIKSSAGRGRLATLIGAFILISAAASALVVVRGRAAEGSFPWPASLSRIFASRSARTLEPVVLNGTYTVGTGGAYTTLTAAVADYVSNGVSGPVTFSLTDTTYSSETYPITIGAATGSSATNTLTIKPAIGVTPTFSATTGTNVPMFDFNGASNVIIDGSNAVGGTTKDLTITNLSSVSPTIRLTVAANSNTIKNANLKGSGGGGNTQAVVTFGGATSPSTISGNTVQNCFITNSGVISNPTYGVALTGNSTATQNANTITGNTFSGLYVGIELYQYYTSSVFSSNTIFDTTATTYSVGKYGINLDGNYGTATISGNRIYDLKTTASAVFLYGIIVLPLTATDNATVSNNQIALDATAAAQGIEAILVASSAAGTTNVYANSIRISGVTADTNNSVGIDCGNPAATTNIKDNIVVVLRAGSGSVKSWGLRLQSPSVVANVNSDYNDVYVSGANTFFGNDGTADRTTLSAWQTAHPTFDASSISADPNFTLATDLHIKNGSADVTSPVARKGLFIAGITTDIDGNTRRTGAFPDAPDIGADEFTTYLLNSSAGANGSISPLLTNAIYNPGTSQSFTITPDSNFAIASVTDNSVAQSATSPYNLTSIAADHTIAATFSPVAGSLQFASAPYTNGETNADHTFTVHVSRTGGSSGAVSVNYAVTDGSANSPVDYTASPPSGTLNWADSDSADKTFDITVKGDTTVEFNETVGLTLTSPTGGAALGADSSTTLTITNDDAADQTFSASGNLSPGTYNNITINSPAVVTLTGDVIINGTITINGGGTLDCGGFTVSGPGTFTLNAGGTLAVGDVNGITTAACGTGTGCGSIRTNARTFPSTANYTYDGIANQSVGNGLPSSVVNLTIANTGGAGNKTVTGNSGQIVTGTLQVQSGIYSSHSDYVDVVINNAGTLSLAADITVSGNWTNNGTFISNGFKVTFDGAANQTIGGTNSTTFATLQVSNSGTAPTNVVALAVNTTASALSVTAGVFDQGAGASSSNFSAAGATIAAGATWRNLGTGDLTLSGDVANSGTITFNANGTGCNEIATNDIQIRSSNPGMPRTWSGTGTFSMIDVDVADQKVPGLLTPPLFILVNSGTDSGGNTGWTFVDQCTSGTYTWIGGTAGANTDWQVGTNWNPTRAPAAGDILIFDGLSTPAPIVTNVPTETDGALRLVNGVNGVTLNASVLGARTLTLSGTTGSDLSVPAGTLLTLAGANGLTISLTGGGTQPQGSVGGQIILQGGPHRLIGSNTGEIIFASGSIFTASSLPAGFTGNPFGAGTADSVRFQSGSSAFFNAGSDPFGGSGNAVATFSQGSTQTFNASTAFSANGRTYGNLTLNGSQTYFDSTATNQATVFNTLTIQSGSTLKLSDSAGGDLNLLGNFSDSGTFNPNGRTVKFQGGNSLQTITKSSGAESFFDVFVSLSAGGELKLLSPATIGGELNLSTVASELELNSQTLTLNGTINGLGLLKGDTGATINIGGTGALGTLNFASGTRTLSALTVARSGSATLGNDLVIVNALTLTNGVVNTANTLSLGSAATASSAGGYVNGNLQKSFGASGNLGSFTFPVGTANGYSPLDANVTANTNGTLTVKAVHGKQPNISGTNALQRYWILSGSGLTTDLTFHYNVVTPNDVIGNEANYKIFKYDGSFTLVAPQSTNTVAHTATVTGVTSFSDWTLAEPTAIMPGTLQFVGAPYTDPEMDSSTHTKTITVSRTGGSDGAVDVTYATSAGTATAGSDYVETTATLHWNNGETVDKSFNITVNGDTTYEANETVNITLSNVTDGATIAPPNPTTLTITNDDPVPANATLVVNTTDDNDFGACVTAHCSLREAINAANSLPDTNTINFNIPGGGVRTITPGTALPTITRPANLNGYSQPLATANTLAVGDDANLLIELDGTSAGAGAIGLEFGATASSSSVRGLIINRFTLDGVRLTANSGCVVAGNFIGTNAAGTAASGNLHGVFVNGANNSTIGGTTAADRNIISGSKPGGNQGVQIAGTVTGNVVKGNYIGTNAAGTAAVPNSGDGIRVVNTLIGGTTSLEANVIAGNTLSGISITGDGTIVKGNFIGANSAGAVLGNGDAGIQIVSANNSVIGGAAAGEPNTIANSGNGKAGVFVQSGTGNAIRANSIHDNGGLGIDLGTGGLTANDPGDPDTGANNLQNFPVITSSKVTGPTKTIKGTLNSIASQSFTIEFFANATCDGSGYGEGSTYLGSTPVTTDGSGNGSFTFHPGTLAVGDVITATATDSGNNTSEFSACFTTIAGTPGTLQFSAANSNDTELNSSTHPVTITVTRTGGLDGDVSVHYATSDGTATAGSDYDAASGDFTWLEGDGAGKTFNVTIHGDNTYEANETINLTLSNAQVASLGSPSTATITIINDDTPPATLTVNTTDDNDFTACLVAHCSLREAINAANFNVDTNTINFDIPISDSNRDGTSGVFTISPASALPTITNPVTIDGYTQTPCAGPNAPPCSKPNTQTDNTDDAVILIELTGINAGLNTDGLVLSGGNLSTVSGLIINRFGGAGVKVTVGGFDNVTGNFIGTDATGLLGVDGSSLPYGNGVGIVVDNVDNNMIGCTTADERNIISANIGAGISIVGSSANMNLVWGNLIGTRKDGTPLGNGGAGVSIDGGSDSTIGVDQSPVPDGQGNVIANNTGAGVEVKGSGIGNIINQNSIYGNTGLGIDLGADGVTDNDPGDTTPGPNNLQNFPDITVATAGSTAVAGTLNTAVNSTSGYRIELFTNDACDTSTHGEGKTLIGSTTTGVTDGSGNVGFTITVSTPLALNQVLTATATDVDGNTSEFSSCYPVTAAPTLNVGDRSLAEGNPSGTTNFDFAVTLSAPTAVPVVVDYSTADGTTDPANAGTDYTAVGNGQITIPAGSTSGTITIAVSKDTTFELNETFFVNITSASPVTPGDYQGLGTITNDDPVPTISINDVTQTEGDGPGSTNFDFTVSLTNPSYLQITVDYATSDGTASSLSDYNATNGQLTFNPGETSKIISVQVNGDFAFENSETFFVDLSNLSNATMGDSHGVGTITNDDTKPELSINDRSLNEGTTPGPTTPFTFTVSRTVADATSSVDYATANGSGNPATGGAACGAGVDYISKSDTLNFPASGPGATSQTITVLVCKDADFEPNETFVVNLSNAVDATITDNQGVGTILNDDVPGTGFLVNTTNDIDDGNCNVAHCSLREAINATNTAVTAVAIKFDIPVTDPRHFYYKDDGVANQVTNDLSHVVVTTAVDDASLPADKDPDWPHSWWSILPSSQLPSISKQVFVDGYSQTGATVNSLTAGDNAVLRIELDGASSGLVVQGLSLTAGVSTVRGLVINRFKADAGDPTPTGVGLRVQSTSDSVLGNFIGTDVSGTLDLGNEGSGLFAPGSNATIGGATPDVFNLISGNDVDGILFSNSNSNVIQGNLIGTRANGTSALGNNGNGISFSGGGSGFNSIGGIGVGEGNTIAFNGLTGGDGVRLDATAINGNAIRGNSIFSNGKLGINLVGGIEDVNGVTANDAKDPDSGPNGLQNFPIITSVLVTGSTRTITGTLNSTTADTFTIDFYQSPSCDTSGNGEGKTYLGSTPVTTDGTTGDGSFTFHPAFLTVGQVVTATATTTGAFFNTSEFSACSSVIDGSPGAGDIQFTSATYSVAENVAGLHQAAITLTRVGGTNGSISSTFTTSNGTATSGTDFNDASQTVTFVEGETGPKTINVTINDDSIYEGDETVALSLGTSTINAAQSDGSFTPAVDPHAAVLTIVENDPKPTFAISDVTHSEGDSGMTSYAFTVTKTGSTALNAGVSFQTQDGTVSGALGAATAPGDYQALSGTLTFLPSDTSKTITVLVNGDTTVEPDERFFVNLSNPTNATILDNQGVGVITNDDTDVTVAVSPASVAEDGVANLVYTFTRTGVAGSALTVNFSVGGTATFGTDYAQSGATTFSASSGTVTIGAGNSSATVTIDPTPDIIFEPNETVILTVTAGTGYNAGSPGAATGTINNDDAAGGIIQFTANTYNTTENSRSITITVERLGSTSGAVTANYATPDDSEATTVTPCSTNTSGFASPRCDFTTALGTIRFADGDATPKTFDILISQDSYVEPPELLTVTLSNLTGSAVFGANTTATVRIDDDDLSAPVSNPIDDSQNFVRQHYHDFLNREPDASGLAFWTNEIDSCGSNQQCIDFKRVQVSAAFYLSIEFQDTGYLVERLYKSSYGDANGTSTFNGAHSLTVPVVRFSEFLGDTQEIGQGVVVGAAGWPQALENNKAAFADKFVQRARFVAAFPLSMTPAEFVDKLNLNAGNPLSQAERDQLVADLTSNGKTRAQVLRAVADDQDLKNSEFNRAFVLMQYFGYLRRNPNVAPDSNYSGYDFWLTKLNQFNGNFQNADMVKAFITSAEYRNRSGP